MEKATFAAGCFWGVEAAFRRVEGVTATAVGYSGGTTENPTYREVCTGRTGHAEVVQVDFDPQRVSYDTLLDVFWEVHDPTTLNRQGPDVGTQYRSAVFYRNTAQREATDRYLAKLREARVWPGKIVTQVSALRGFHAAEEYHQNYLVRHPTQPYIVINEASKMTMPVALIQFRADYWSNYGQLMAGTTVSALPAILIFLAAQRMIIRSITLAGVKG